MAVCTRAEDKQVWRELGDQIKGENGLTIKDRTYAFRTYRSVFLGTELVDWLLDNSFCRTREEAVSIGIEMLQNDVFHHVTYGHSFKDEYLFYRFPEDDPLKKKIELGGPSVAALLADCGVTKAGWVLRKGTLFWSKRFLMIKQDEGRLYYFTSNLEPAPKFVVDLGDGISVREEPSHVKKNHYCFSIFSSNSSLTFAVKTSSEQEEWMEALVDAGIDMIEESMDGYVETNVYDFTCTDIDEQELPLSMFKGKVSLVVNVATK